MKNVVSLVSILLLTAFLIPVSITDVKRRVIPNGYPLGIAISGTALVVLKSVVNRPEWKETVLSALLGLLLGAGISALCRLIVKDGIGLGDVKLLMALGLYQGIRIFPQMLAISSLAALLAALVVKIRKREQTTLPFAPFLSAGAAAAQIIGAIV